MAAFRTSERMLARFTQNISEQAPQLGKSVTLLQRRPSSQIHAICRSFDGQRRGISSTKSRHDGPRSSTTKGPTTITSNDHKIQDGIQKSPRSKLQFVPPRPKRIVVGITGATGAPYAIRLLEVLREIDVETHLVMSKWALATLKYESPLNEMQIRGLAHTNYTMKELCAPIASGSFQHDGMIIVPCSMKTLAAVRMGFGDDLIARSADVTLKEGRKLVLAVRETPLNDIHLENMLALRRAGAVIFPPVPAFYTRPKTIDEIVNQSVGRMLDALGFYVEGFERWEGFRKD